MPENLRITAPVPNSDGILKPNPSAQSSQIEPMDPARVNRPNTQDQNTDSASLNLLLSRDSVFGKFIQQLRQTPALSETLGKLLLNTVRRMETNPGFLPENSALRELVSSLAAEQDGLINDLVFQQKNSTLFSGPLFQLLSRISQQAEDPQLDLRIAGFLKAFDGFSSAKETTDAILSNLSAIGRRIPTNYAKQLALLSEKLNTSDPEGAVNENLNLLKKEILPFLSDYVSKSSDYGKMRETLSLLLQNLSILNVSSRENLQSQFQQLAAYCGRHTAEPTLRLMRSFFADTVEAGAGKEKPESRFLHSLVALLSHGGQGSSGADQAAVGDIGKALLLDNSVYMPFTHLFLPAVLQGRFLFSQIWVEKKDRNDEGHAVPGAAAPPKRLYLSFEIQDLGSFEAKVELTGKKIDLSLACPEKLLGQTGAITSSLARILDRNGFSFGDIRLSRFEKPQIPELILQKTMERKRSVDVTI
ncbi:hypothetical protein [Caproicibacter sp.]|uniref:hypothetical protein n=1 Tax=Caproicibacter sp. TaxID=2814884 RepID=UPI0039896C38